MLISIGILMVGLVGVSMLIPIGKLSLMATNIADRTGACGRAALREVKVRRMLDYTLWLQNSTPVPPTNTTLQAIAIDPLAVAAGVTANLGGTAGSVPRLSLNSAVISPNVFSWPDDLTFVLPADMNPPQTGDRPLPVLSGRVQQSDGNFSWFLTLVPVPSEASLPVAQRTTYDVSAVVCDKRNLTLSGGSPSGEHATTAALTFPR